MHGVCMQLSSEQFEKILSALRSDSPVSSTKDKRRKPRVGLRASITVIEAGTRGKGTRVSATIRDVSREGLGIQRSVVMKPGTRFLVQLPSNDGPPQTILCTVRHCEAVADSTFHVGCTFIRVCNVNPKAEAPILNADAAEAIAIQEGAAAGSSTATVGASKDVDSARIRKAILS